METVHGSLDQLPTKPMDWLTRSFTQFLRVEAAAGAVLLVCTLIALTLSNSPWSQPFLSFWQIPIGLRIGSIEINRTLQHWINDGLMTLFFFIVALELKREMVLGELRSLRMAALSFAGALGGMVMPAGIYLALRRGGEGAHGWGTVMATDTAFVVGCLAILGSRIPQSLRLFLLSLAIYDDIGAILVIAIGYGDDLSWRAVVAASFGVAFVAAMARAGVRNIPAYFLAGVIVWVALDRSGIHPTIAGVVLGLMAPAQSWVNDNRLHAILERVLAYPRGEHWSGDTVNRRDLKRANIATREALSPIERLELTLHPWVGFGVVPLFALANAGVPFSAASIDVPIVLSIFTGFVVGKPLGVIVFAFVAVRLRWAALPLELNWRLLAAGSVLTGIGFTMALLIAELAFSSTLIHSAKAGILSASIVSGIVGLFALTWLTGAGQTGTFRTRE